MIRYLEASIENMRDIGGYRVSYGNISYQKLIRSNLPNKLSKDDVFFIKQLGVTSIIDLRTEEEYLHRVSDFENHSNFQLYHCPLNVGKDVPQSANDVPLSYLEILEDKENILKILTVFANEENGVLYFCNAGKDRTGVITALIMMILGADESDIIADYLLTKDYMKDILQAFINQSERDIGDIIIPQAEYMEKFLSGFKMKYGTITNYLQYIGFSVSDKVKLRNALVSDFDKDTL